MNDAIKQSEWTSKDESDYQVLGQRLRVYNEFLKQERIRALSEPVQSCRLLIIDFKRRQLVKAWSLEVTKDYTFTKAASK